jgi:hypothetical protein
MTRAPRPARPKIVDFQEVRRDHERRQLPETARALSERRRKREWQRFRARHRCCPTCGRAT